MLITNEERTERIYLKDTNGLTMSLKQIDSCDELYGSTTTTTLIMMINGIEMVRRTFSTRTIDSGGTYVNIDITELMDKYINPERKRLLGFMDEIHHQIEIAEGFTDDYHIAISPNYTISIKQ